MGGCDVGCGEKTYLIWMIFEGHFLICLSYDLFCSTSPNYRFIKSKNRIRIQTRFFLW